MIGHNQMTNIYQHTLEWKYLLANDNQIKDNHVTLHHCVIKSHNYFHLTFNKSGKRDSTEWNFKSSHACNLHSLMLAWTPVIIGIRNKNTSLHDILVYLHATLN